MPRVKQPIELVIANDRKHLTKAEIEERRAREVKPCTDEIIAPDYLTKKQREEFYKISRQLEKLKIMGETDVDAVARYIIANDMYINATKNLRKTDVRNDPEAFEKWGYIQDRYFKQARACAQDLGLTITSRCKLVVPKSEEPEEKKNKFSVFTKAQNG
ncbi:MAG: phage terminase small subunit P27 family [Clostridia bacterium]|nr:phage terminase small subunit P27 family [Clostridia bacterium]